MRNPSGIPDLKSGSIKRFIAMFLLVASLAVAQPLPSQHGSGSRPSAPRSEPRPSAPSREPRAPRNNAPHNNIRQDHQRRQEQTRKHWNGRRFDERFYRKHFGWNHPVYFEWVGAPCNYGSYFWFEDVQFQITSYPVGCNVVDWYIVWDEASYSYVLVSPETQETYLVQVIW